MTINSLLLQTLPTLSRQNLPSDSNRVAVAPVVVGGAAVVGAAVVVESLIATGIVVLGTAVLYTATKELTKAISDAVQAYGIPYATDKAKQMRSALQIAYQEGSSRYGAGTAQAYRFMLDSVKQWIRGGPNAPVIPNQTKTIPSFTPQSEPIQVNPSTFPSDNELASQIKGGNTKAYQLYESVRQLDVWLRSGKGENTGPKRTATGKQLMELLSSMRVGGQPIPLAVMTARGMVNFQVARVNNNVLAITSGSETLHVAIKGSGLNVADTIKTIEAILETTGQFGRKKTPPSKVPPVTPLPDISGNVPPVVPLPTIPKPGPRPGSTIKPGPITKPPPSGGVPPPNKGPKNTPPPFNRATVLAAAYAELLKLASGTKNSAETDRAIEKWVEKIGWITDQQKIDDYRSGRTTVRSGRESQRLSDALDAIDRMRIGAGTGGASSVKYDPSKAADFIIESVARYGKDLGISLAFTRELKNLLEQRIAGLSSNDPAANKLQQALRHLIEHELLLQTKNAKLDALTQAVNSQNLAVRSLRTLKFLHSILSARGASIDMNPGQRTANQTALDILLKEIKSRDAAPNAVDSSVADLVKLLAPTMAPGANYVTAHAAQIKVKKWVFDTLNALGIGTTLGPPPLKRGEVEKPGQRIRLTREQAETAVHTLVALSKLPDSVKNDPYVRNLVLSIGYHLLAPHIQNAPQNQNSDRNIIENFSMRDALSAMTQSNSPGCPSLNTKLWKDAKDALIPWMRSWSQALTANANTTLGEKGLMVPTNQLLLRILVGNDATAVGNATSARGGKLHQNAPDATSSVPGINPDHYLPIAFGQGVAWATIWAKLMPALHELHNAFGLLARGPIEYGGGINVLVVAPGKKLTLQLLSAPENARALLQISGKYLDDLKHLEQDPKRPRSGLTITGGILKFLELNELKPQRFTIDTIGLLSARGMISLAHPKVALVQDFFARLEVANASREPSAVKLKNAQKLLKEYNDVIYPILLDMNKVTIKEQTMLANRCLALRYLMDLSGNLHLNPRDLKSLMDNPPPDLLQLTEDQLTNIYKIGGATIVGGNVVSVRRKFLGIF